MHKYAKFDHNIQCGSRAMSILLSANELTDSYSDYSAHLWVVQLINADNLFKKSTGTK